MMKKILAAILMAVALAVSGVGGLSANVQATSICDDLSDEELKEAAGCNTTQTIGGAANIIIQVVLSLVGIGAVVVMIYGGVLYMISSGDAAKAKRARDVILYGLVGMMVALLAFAIVSFVGKGIPE